MEFQSDIDVSIIIVSYRTRDLIRKCLKSILESDSKVSLEVIVIDNASGDGTPEIVEKEFPKVRLIRNSKNLGYARAVNQGLKAARGKYMLVLNPDIEVFPDSIDNLWQFMETNPDVGIAGAKLIYPDGTIQFSCRTFYSLPVVLLRRTFLGRLFPNTRIVREHLMADWDHSSVREVDWVLGACMMVRRKAYEAVGGMDERFFLYLEDVDWCYRMKKHNWKVCYVPSSVMVHHYRRESARIFPDRKFLAHLLSTFHFFDKWSSRAYRIKRERRTILLVATLAVDIISINVAFLLSYYIRYLLRDNFVKPLYPIATYRGFILFVNLVCLFAFVYSGLYSRLRGMTFVKDLVRVMRAVLASSLVIMAATYLTRTIAYSRFIVAIFWPLCGILVACGRATLRQMHRSLRRSRFDLRRAVVVGSGKDAIELKENILSGGAGEFDFIGFVTPSEETIEEMKPLLGKTAEIDRIVCDHRVTDVFVSQSSVDREEIGKIVLVARRYGAEVRVVTQITDILVRGSTIEEIGGVAFISFPPSSLSGAKLVTKYLSDRILGLIGLLGVAVIAPGVVIYQLLTHRNFRTIATTLAKLGSVVAGTRSLVGPKSLAVGGSIKPGITGLWLVGGHGFSGFEKSDVFYVENWSISLDVEILLMSLKRIAQLFEPDKEKDGER